MTARLTPERLAEIRAHRLTPEFLRDTLRQVASDNDAAATALELHIEALEADLRVVRGVPAGREADAHVYELAAQEVERASREVHVTVGLKSTPQDVARNTCIALAHRIRRLAAGGRPAEPHPPIPNGAEPARLATAGQAEPAPLSVEPCGAYWAPAPLLLRRGPCRLPHGHAGQHLDSNPAREFFLRCWGTALDGQEIEENDVMEWGAELGLLTCVRATEPCGENCLCKEYIGEDFPTDCYRLAGEQGKV